MVLIGTDGTEHHLTLLPGISTNAPQKGNTAVQIHQDFFAHFLHLGGENQQYLSVVHTVKDTVQCFGGSKDTNQSIQTRFNVVEHHHGTDQHHHINAHHDFSNGNMTVAPLDQTGENIGASCSGAPHKDDGQSHADAQTAEQCRQNVFPFVDGKIGRHIVQHDGEDQNRFQRLDGKIFPQKEPGQQQQRYIDGHRHHTKRKAEQVIENNGNTGYSSRSDFTGSRKTAQTHSKKQGAYNVIDNIPQIPSDVPFFLIQYNHDPPHKHIYTVFCSSAARIA